MQHSLPLDPQPPSPAEVEAEVMRLLCSRAFWRRRGPPEKLLANPVRAAMLRKCARQLLIERQRRLLALNQKGG